VEERQVSAGWRERYLALLGMAGVETERPSLEALARLVRAQGETGVFENVTAILRRARAGDGPVPPVDLDALLRARAARRGGGVCFEHTPMFRQLLAALGYRVQPILAQISFPGSHHATVVDFDGGDGTEDGGVRVDGRSDGGGARYLVDIGGGAPLWQPFKIGDTVEIRQAGLGYRLRLAGPAEAEGDEPDVYVQERWIDGEWQVFCRYDLRPAGAAAREAAYQRHQLAGATWVVGNLTLVRCTAEAVYRLRDDELVTHTAGGKRTDHLVTDADYRQVAADVFGLPGLPIDEARAALDDMKRRRAG
jgi:arylamine N-acetyltransferase